MAPAALNRTDLDRRDLPQAGVCRAEDRQAQQRREPGGEAARPTPRNSNAPKRSSQDLEPEIVLSVDNAGGQIVTSRQRIVPTGESRRLALESLDAGQERLRAGTGTTFEVLELQKRLIEAEAAQLRARADYNKAVSEYQRQIGTALREHGVVLK